MIRYILISLLTSLFIFNSAKSDISKKIIYNLEKSNNYHFKFTQNINEEKETGKCILSFNRKINCKYDNSGKILISDGKNLIIKNNVSNNPSFYKLENTSFYKILDKDYLINELKIRKVVNEKGKIFVNVNYQNNKIIVFFDKDKFHISGWRTTDLYNNSIFTEIDIIEINKKIEKKLFDLKNIN